MNGVDLDAIVGGTLQIGRRLGEGLHQGHDLLLVEHVRGKAVAW